MFRLPRRLHLHRAGWVFSIGAVFLGMAAIATGNNLLFLMLGAMLGIIALSGWMSELVLRGVEVRRRLPRGATAGASTRIGYQVTNRKRWLPSFALEIGEAGRAARAFVPAVEAGEVVTVWAEEVFAHRGIYPLQLVTVSTSFPFGLFRKERDLELNGEVVVWPRTDRPVRAVRRPADRSPRAGVSQANAAGARGEYRGLRDYRPGDDPRDVHWRSSARRTVPVVREFERDDAETLWICLDLRVPAGARAEAAVETAATLAARARDGGGSFALVTGDVRTGPGAGTAHLERILDLLAGARFRADAPPLCGPLDPAAAVLVTAGSVHGAGWADALIAGEEGA
jgi:uncharacterized protein (DUF58 family)